MEDDDRAVLRRQLPECALQGIAIVDRDDFVRSARSVDRERPDVGAPPLVSAVLLVTGVDEEPMEPDLEALRVTQPRKLTPGKEECLLDGVLGPLDIAKDPVRDGVAAVTVEVDERGEGVVVACPRSLDQPRSHGRPSRRRPVGRFTR